MCVRGSSRLKILKWKKPYSLYPETTDNWLALVDPVTLSDLPTTLSCRPCVVMQTFRLSLCVTPQKKVNFCTSQAHDHLWWHGNGYIMVLQGSPSSSSWYSLLSSKTGFYWAAQSKHFEQGKEDNNTHTHPEICNASMHEGTQKAHAHAVTRNAHTCPALNTWQQMKIPTLHLVHTTSTWPPMMTWKWLHNGAPRKPIIIIMIFFIIIKDRLLLSCSVQALWARQRR